MLIVIGNLGEGRREEGKVYVYIVNNYFMLIIIFINVFRYFINNIDNVKFFNFIVYYYIFNKFL